MFRWKAKLSAGGAAKKSKPDGICIDKRGKVRSFNPKKLSRKKCGSLRGPGRTYGSGFIDRIFPVMSPTAQQLLDILQKEVDQSRIITNYAPHFRHIAVCPMISQYNLDEHEEVRNLMHLLSKRVHMEGFNCLDHLHSIMIAWILFCLISDRVRKIVYVDNIAHGHDSAPSVIVGLFSVRNIGKQLIHLSD
ncbi:hypothetical protein FEM48_Zijuj01G0115300 [Ziziphus jujuba var. spinosa]|uniref:Uncharacterized protein n=1 Tax=Ziziphus jujuba var. spinosa TaxID=714518 RepID=A0A978W111_ZIZJJ|nr:hypothetical protein FEM48_Zijuj01G0115300 [Ziziphus jujuba var. spinosa]